MNGYLAFYRGKTLEIWAETSLGAQRQAAFLFRAKKQHQVAVVLAEREGKPVAVAPESL